MSKFNNISVALWVSVLSFVCSLSLSESQIMGDGKEYLLYARAFAAHLSPEIKQEDILHVASMLDNSAPSFRAEMEKFGKEYTINGLQYGKGFVTSPGGELFSWHFWLYPLFVAPFFEVTDRLGLPPAYAFTLCNWAFVLGALTYLLFFWNASSTQKILLSALFLLTGTTYYIWWSHPEVFTASLMLLALMMTSDKRYGLAMMFGAIAATQNPPLVLLIGLIAAIAAFDIAQENKGSVLGVKLSLISSKILPYLLASLVIAFLPVFYFQYMLGVANPIAAGGSADSALISFSRLGSLFFDINMGMIVAAPGIFVGIVIVLLASAVDLNGNGWRRVVGRNWFLFACVALSLAMALPALATTNWNHGHSVFSRYAYWLAVPLIYGLVVSLNNITSRMRVFTAIAIICIQLGVVTYYGLFGKNGRSDYLSFKPISDYVLLNFPGLYNPIPEIFIERLNRQEGVPNASDANQHIFAYPSANQPTKLLLTKFVADSVEKECSPASVVSSEGEWTYMNLQPNSKCSLAIAHQPF